MFHDSVDYGGYCNLNTSNNNDDDYLHFHLHLCKFSDISDTLTYF